MPKTKQKIEIWEEDRGWIYWCGNCKGKVEDEGTCPHCHIKFKETIRV